MPASKSLLLTTTVIGLSLSSVALAQTSPTAPATQPAQPNASQAPRSTQPTTPAELGAAADPATAATTGPDDAKPAAQPGQTANPVTGELEGVVVTGSRLRRNEYTAADPITVITAEQATLGGFTDTASLLQSSSVAASSFQTNTQLTGYVTTGGPGAKTLSIRNLGSQRTLVLLNGQRMGPAGVGGTVGPVDLSVIPESSIERVEILKDGASSLYGSDAVGGVVNIITKQNQDGGELRVNGNNTEHGGGNSYQVSGDWGKKFDRGYINVAAEYFRQEALRNENRYNLKCAEDYLFDPNTFNRVDFTTPYFNEGHNFKCYNQSNNLISTTAYGSLQYLQPGVIYPTVAQGNNVPAALAGTFARQARAGYPLTYPYANYTNPFYDEATALSPETHYNAQINGGYNLTKDIQLYAGFLYSQRDSEQDGSRQFFPTLTAPWVAGNPNNIFQGTGVTPTYSVSALPSDYFQHVHYYRGNLGVKGKFSNLGYLDRFSFEVYGTYSRSDANYKQDIIYNDRVLATTTSALGCATAGITNISNYDCSTLPAAGIPWLSSRVASGQFSPAERAFLFTREGGHTIYDQYLVEGSVSGDLFTLWAGPVSAALGVSYRHDHIDDQPDHDVALNNVWGQTAAGRTTGSDANKEAFAEVDIPVFKNLPLLQSVDIDMSGRYSDYESYGSNTTYKINVNWQIIPDIRLRGTIGTSYRAPALYEQFLANQAAFTGQGNIDPCINYQDDSNAIRQANCRAALNSIFENTGLPYLGASPNGGGGSATVYTGGGRGVLTAETSESRTAGVVFTPKFINRWVDLSLAVDYYDIEVNNEVDQFGAANILNQCYSAGDYPNNVYCTLFRRDTDPASPSYLNILTVQNNYLNVAQQVVRGISASLRLSHDFGDLGRVTLDGDFEWRLHDTTQILSQIDPENYLGTTYNYNGPDFNGQARLRYDRGPFTVFWQTNFIGKGSDTETFGGDVFYNSRYANVPAGISGNVCTGENPAPGNACVYYKQYNGFYTTHNASVRYRVEPYNADVTFGIQNVFDYQAPLSSAGQFRRGTETQNAYDLLGRRFFVNVVKRF